MHGTWKCFIKGNLIFVEKMVLLFWQWLGIPSTVYLAGVLDKRSTVYLVNDTGIVMYTDGVFLFLDENLLMLLVIN